MNNDDKLKEKHKIIFSRKLNYYMQLNHKQQDDIVNDLGINKSTISTWCRGLKMPRVNAIQALADYFGVSITDLLTEENKTESDSKLNDIDEEILNIFNRLSEEKKKQILDYIAFLAAQE